MKKLKYILIIFCFTFHCSCDSFLDVRPEGEVVNNELFKNAAGFEDAIYIKQIDMLPGKVVLRSLNTTYPPVELDVREDLATQFRVVGQVLWVGREYH